MPCSNRKMWKNDSLMDWAEIGETGRTQRPPKVQAVMTANKVATDAVDSALGIHRALGPGLLESAWQACLAYDFKSRQHAVECEVVFLLAFEGMHIEVGYCIDMRIDGLVLVESKILEKILPIHTTQLLTYLN